MQVKSILKELFLCSLIMALVVVLQHTVLLNLVLDVNLADTYYVIKDDSGRLTYSVAIFLMYVVYMLRAVKSKFTSTAIVIPALLLGTALLLIITHAIAGLARAAGFAEGMQYQLNLRAQQRLLTNHSFSIWSAMPFILYTLQALVLLNLFWVIYKYKKAKAVALAAQ